MKKVLSVILTISILLSTLAVFGVSSSAAKPAIFGDREFLMGDVNENGTVDFTDMLYINKRRADRGTVEDDLTGSDDSTVITPTKKDILLGDVDGDGQLTYDDMTLINRIRLGKTDQYSAPVYSKILSLGYCGEKVKAILFFDGTLEVFGSGDMYDYTWDACPFQRNDIVEVIISDGVTSIGDNAFYYCSGLTSITIPNSVTSIGSEVFSGCSGLTNIVVASGNTKYDSRNNCNAIIETQNNTLIAGCKNTVIPNSVTSIGDSAFRGCSGLKSITIPNSVTSIGDSAFRGCSGLKSITIPNSVTSIGDSAFWSCYALTSVTIPNSVTSISSGAFCNCSALAGITIPNSVTSIGGSAFYGCSGLTSISIPNSVTSIGASAFGGCKGLTSINIGDSVTSIGNSAFHQCSGLTSITIPNSVTNIGDNAFHGCQGLTSITIPNSVTSIGSHAFWDCSSLADVFYGGTKQEWEQGVSIGSGNNALTNATIHFSDNEPPTCTVGSTNQISTSQTVTLSLSDNIGIAGYYWGTNSSYSSNTYTSVSGSPTTKSVTKTVSDSGTYYLTAKDTSGNVSSTQSITFYKTTLNANNGSVSPSYVITKSGNSFTLPTPTRSGYTFDGWYTEASGGSKVSNTYTVSGNTILYAHWTEATKPTVSISTNNNVATSQTVTLTLNDNVGIAGYYWGTNSSYSSNTYTSVSGSPTTKSITKTVSDSGTYYLTAKDTSGNVSSTQSITFYKTTLNANNGSVSPSYVITKSGSTFTLPTPTRSGYTFDGWYTEASGGSKVSNTYTVSGNTKLYAHWIEATKPTVSISTTNNVATSQTVTLTLNDNVGVAGYYWGTNSSYLSNTYTSVSGSPTTKSVTKTVSDSGTYYLTAKDTSGNVSSTQSITFYKTTLNANNGSVSPNHVITKSGNSFTLPTPTRSGYTFDGWYTEASGGSKVSSTYTVSGKTTLYAHWIYHTHNYTSVVTKAATCGASGVRTYTCSVCGDSYTESIPATGKHTYTSKVTKAATCTASGVRTYTCSVCDYSYTESIPAPGKHTYTSKVTKAATCGASGVRTYTCSVCGDSYTETIAVTNNHSYSSRITRSATCGASGVRTYTCSVCGDSYTETIAPTGNHSWDKGRVTVAPTCYSFGEIIYTCTVCHETEWQLMDMLAHHFVKTTKKATLKANGAVIQKCSVCGEVNGKTVIYYPKTIALSGTKYTYTGKAVTPKMSVKGSNGKVIAASNYTVTYAKGRKAVGRYAVKITFKGLYSGSVTKYFDIVPKGTAFSSASSPKAKAIAIKWKKQSGISGYQVQLATNTAFTKGVKTYNAKASSLNAKISKGIQAKTNYYLRIRTFKTVKYGGKNLVLYSGWSKAVKVKTK